MTDDFNPDDLHPEDIALDPDFTSEMTRLRAVVEQDCQMTTASTCYRAHARDQAASVFDTSAAIGGHIVGATYPINLTHGVTASMF